MPVPSQHEAKADDAVEHDHDGREDGVARHRGVVGDDPQVHTLLPQFLQILLGLTPLQSGLTTFPQAVGVILASQFVGKLYHTVGPRRLVTVGLIMVSLSTVPYMFIGMDVSTWTIRGLMFVRGLSMACSFVPLQASTYANIQKADTGRASAIFSTQRQASAAFGVAILSTVFYSWRNHVTTGAQPTPANLLSAFHVAFGASIVISFVGAAYAWFFIKDIDAAPTMNPKPPKTAAVNG